MEKVINDVRRLGSDVKLLSKKEMAAELGVSYRTIERWFKNGYLNRIRIGGRIFFSYAEVFRIRDQFVTGNAYGSYLEPMKQNFNDIRNAVADDLSRGISYRQ